MTPIHAVEATLATAEPSSAGIANEAVMNVVKAFSPSSPSSHGTQAGPAGPGTCTVVTSVQDGGQHSDDTGPGRVLAVNHLLL